MPRSLSRPRSSALLVALALAPLSLTSVAHAVTAPTSGGGHEHLRALTGPALRGERVLSHERAPRARLAELAKLEAQTGVRWRASWDKATWVPVRLWGAGVAAPGSTSSAAAAEKHARALLSAHARLVAPFADPGEFRLITNDLSAGLRTVAFQQTAHGLDVVGAHVSFRFKNDRLFMIASSAKPTSGARPAAASSSKLEAVARAAAEAALLADVATSAEASEVSEPLVLPLVGRTGSLGARTVVRVTARTEPLGKWDVYVDAATGEAVARQQMLRFATGTVLLDAPVRRPTALRAQFPASRATVTLDGLETESATDGTVSWATEVPASAELALVGPLVRVLDDAGPEATVAFPLDPGGTFVWSEAATELVDSQLTTFVHTGEVKARVKAIAPTFTFVNQQTDATVNIDDQCNAFSDGTDINFFRAGGPCENTGRLSDVVHHEYGHSTHFHAILPGAGAFDGALSEGISDYLAATMSDDSGMGRGFFYSDQPLRELDPPNFEHRWPDDIAGDVHETGLIIGGALWDLRELLVDKHGQELGVATADDLWFQSIRRAEDIPTMYHEVLAADDDDGDLENGTPNVCEINQAFGRHGLQAWSATVTDLAGATSTDGYAVSAAITGLYDACPGESVTGVELRWNVRGASMTETIAMAPSGGTYLASIPPQPPGTVVQYRVVVQLETGDSFSLPQNPADPKYEMFVGEVVPLYCTDFEDDPFAAGWTHELVDGPDNEGADDWQWGNPSSQAGSGDPDDAFSGSRVLGNDLGKGNFNGTYQPNIVNRASTPVIDVQGYTDVRLQYRRWLNVEDAFFDQATIYANGEAAWQNLDSEQGEASSTHHEDGEWRFHDVELSPFVSDEGTVQVSWELATDQGLQLGGWTLDDVCVVAYVAPAPPPAECGNGVLEEGEACDGGPSELCRPDCTVPACGDGLADEGEACDDGNLSDGDGCSASCEQELPAGGGGDGVKASGGCGCRTSAPDDGGAWGALALGALGLALGRRRARRSR